MRLIITIIIILAISTTTQAFKIGVGGDINSEENSWGDTIRLLRNPDFNIAWAKEINENTASILKQANIKAINTDGTIKGINNTNNPLILTTQQTKIGIIHYTNLKNLTTQINQIHKKTDYIFVCADSGEAKSLGHEVIDLGADVFIQESDNFDGIEEYKSKLIIHGTGSLMKNKVNDSSVFYQIIIDNWRLHKVRVDFIKTSNPVSYSKSEQTRYSWKKLKDLSAGYNTYLNDQYISLVRQ